MKSIANMCSFGARDAGTFLLLVRPPIATPGVGGKRHKHR
ncbi:MAG: hypothetical protein K0R38_284 [Polyangiaceae bacterium]|jgi:hypothetical protein|nr:hypothetical protein [Polyangiaceae bacterium]